MGSRRLGQLGKRSLSVLGLTLALLGSTQIAEARHHRAGGGGHHLRFAGHVRHGHARGSLVDSPGFSAMVVDAGTGRTLYALHENELRHPASITKVMTLYLLFEKLEQGDLRLDSRIEVSAHAASQAPTKLGLRPGSSIAVEDAVKAIVTKSANDMAVAIAERIGGDEATFAGMMTRKAHAIGMSRTIYVNASGLPDDRQLTTARDLTVLGRSIRERFPNYYHFFSTPSFTYAGSFMPNHNHLMSRVEGMDGIKTGYTRASGFNLLSSVNRDGHHIVSVVMGGHTAASRDNIMAGLIEDHIDDAAPTRMADIVPPSAIEEPAPTVRPVAVEADDETEEDRGPNLIAPTLAVPPAPVQRPSDHARTPGQASAVPNASPIERPRPAFIAGAPKIDPARLPSPTSEAERHRLVLDGSTNAHPPKTSASALASTTATPSTLRTPPVRDAVRTASAVAPMPLARPETVPTRNRNDDAKPDRNDTKDRTGSTHGGWIIQIGATDAADKATDLLNRARSQSRVALAHPFTEKVRKGDSTLYRARFAGLDTGEAEQACKALKRSGFACFATKD